ncbi:MAG: DUF2934 domain-containing protein [Terracidiphilus sp.]
MEEMGKKATKATTANKAVKTPAKVETMRATAKTTNAVAAAKPKTTAKKKAMPAAAKPGITREAIAMLAHRYWAERGGSHGNDADDWLRAEQELRGKAS